MKSPKSTTKAEEEKQIVERLEELVDKHQNDGDSNRLYQQFKKLLNNLNHRDNIFADSVAVERDRVSVEEPAAGEPESRIKQLYNELDDFVENNEPPDVTFNNYLQHLLRKSEYKPLVRSISRNLKERGKSPVDLGYDLLNDMAEELYRKENGQGPIGFDFQDPDEVGKDFRKIRESLGVGQRELARTLQIKNVTLSQLETGKYTPSFPKIYEYLKGIEKAWRTKH